MRRHLEQSAPGRVARPLQVGFVYTPDVRAALDPDTQIQESVRLLFQTLLRTGAAHATVKHLREQRRLFPIRLTAGARTGAPVAVVDVDAAGVERVVSEIAAAGGTAHEPVTI